MIPGGLQTRPTEQVGKAGGNSPGRRKKRERKGCEAHYYPRQRVRRVSSESMSHQKRKGVKGEMLRIEPNTFLPHLWLRAPPSLPRPSLKSEEPHAQKEAAASQTSTKLRRLGGDSVAACDRLPPSEPSWRGGVASKIETKSQSPSNPRNPHLRDSLYTSTSTLASCCHDVFVCPCLCLKCILFIFRWSAILVSKTVAYLHYFVDCLHSDSLIEFMVNVITTLSPHTKKLSEFHGYS